MRAHVRKIKGEEPHPFSTVSGAPSEDQWRMEFKAAGLKVEKPPISDVEVGIDRVYADHSEHKIKVFESREQYFNEKAAYARLFDDQVQPTDQIEDEADYHIMDCERYL